MSYIGREPIIGNFVKLDAISVVNGQASYTMQNGGANFTAYETVNQFLVSLNGILQAPTTSFTVSGSTITFASNLVTGDVIDFIIVLGNTLDVGVPSDNTVSLAKLTATGTKDATTFLRGDNTFAEAGGGKILQVVNATDSTTRSSTSTSFVTASNTLTVDITPSSTSSKIFVLISSCVVGTSNSYFTIYRDSTNLGTSIGMTKANLDNQESMAIHYLDSPSTTSQVTYQLYVKADSGTTYINSGGATGSITAFEVGA
jgi:hypothetical protein